jgi:hypothetical protein
MADSKEMTHSLITAAMAWRVKYRKSTADSLVHRMKLQIGDLGVHRKNRGNVYPSGLRCKSLCEEVLEAGFAKEEVNHACVAVEEVPGPETVRIKGYESAAAYNQRESMKDALLSSCFMCPFEGVRHTMLGHNHMMLIMRAFITKAHWELPPHVAKDITYCDESGCLSISAVAANENGKAMAEVIAEGLLCEILSWQMDVEQPNAASTISQALNRGHEIALRTTELTAIAVLNGEIIRLGGKLGTEVAFQTVRDQVRSQLDAVADDPDLPAVFEFLVTAGVGTNTYVDDLLEYGQVFVDSKKRQLRLSAFSVIIRIPSRFQWVRIAMLKRAYRKTPLNGYCANPEPGWTDFGEESLEKLEDMLRFFHNVVGNAGFTSQSRLKMQCNIDIGVTAAFWACMSAKSHKKGGDIAKLKAALIVGAENLDCRAIEYLKLRECSYFPGDERTDIANKRVYHPWIVFTPKVPTPTTAAAEAAPIGPRIIRYDQVTGLQLNTQTQCPTPVTTPVDEKKQLLPWQEWREAHLDMGALEADKAAAVAVMHDLHYGWKVEAGIRMEYVDKEVRVIATADIAEGAVMLPLCVPKQSKVFDKSDHPLAVTLEVFVHKTGGVYSTMSEADPDKIVRHRKFKVIPEFKIPKPVETTAVAATAVEDSAHELPAPPMWIYNEGGPDSLHPFWAVRRMTEQKLSATNEAYKVATPIKPPIHANCVICLQKVSLLSISVLLPPLGTARVISIPFITNDVKIGKGDELIMLSTPSKKEVKAKARTWATSFKGEMAAPQKKAKTSDDEHMFHRVGPACSRSQSDAGHSQTVVAGNC